MKSQLKYETTSPAPVPASYSTHKEDAVEAAKSVIALRAALETETLPRILGLLAQRGIVPTQLSARKCDSCLLVDIEIDERDPEVLNPLMGKLRALMLVDRAMLVAN
ncbi:hypothetical protein [Altericroceibacterium endophyticum]|uniref:ACT domain-containing protein n=1 Tax=Altericroceibacterium endophyticum TaxID=1808508 RepID=A0A6I4T3U9_9SPHN|nr:hypothetical protein [Altericroceibacterium endophyticum]MXO64743.1 hypothetical protein [Altericroceibacterium endophyticum]